jgi:hypothetical protein
LGFEEEFSFDMRRNRKSRGMHVSVHMENVKIAAHDRSCVFRTYPIGGLLSLLRHD